MKKNKLIPLLLAALLAVGAVASSCQKRDPGKDDSSGTTGGSEQTSGLYVADYLPDTTYNNSDFRILTLPDDYANMYTGFLADSSSADKVIAARYKRNSMIEEKYKIKFVEELAQSWEECSSMLESYAGSADDAYELNMLIQREAFVLAIDGYCVTTADLKYNDLTQPWYVHDVNDMLRVNKIYYFAYSAECLNMFAQTNCVFYNIDKGKGISLEDPYSDVKNGTWTFDKMLTYAKAATRDLDNDGTITDNDSVGMNGRGDMIHPTLWIGAGYRTMDKNSDDYPIFTAAGDEKFIDFLTVLSDNVKTGVIFDTTKYPSQKWPSEEHTARAINAFIDGTSLFHVASIGTTFRLNSMENEFRILPAPKSSEEQEEYRSRVVDGWLYVVPSSNTHLDMTSVILEVLAVESANHVYDAYYEEALGNRYARDGENKEMLDLISKTRYLELGDTVWQADIRNNILGAIWDGNNTFSSLLNSKAALIELLIAKYLNAL